MLSALQRRIAQRREDEGFTLIELMVVILIIAILLAIAIPTFLGARARAQDRAAQSNLRNAFTAAETTYANSEDYSGATAAGLSSVEPSLSFVAGAVSTKSAVSVPSTLTSGQQYWTAAAFSQSGNCFYIMTVKATNTIGGGVPATAGTYYAQAAGTSCTATNSETWNSSWT